MTRVIGMGNALVDIMTTLEDDGFLSRFNLPKGSMQLVDRQMINRVLEGTKGLNQVLASGGSAANTIHGLANLGVDTAFLGKVGRDDYGRFFQSDMEKASIRPLLLPGDNETGRAVALVSPDSERTFTTFLGAAAELSAGEISAGHFSGYHLLHVEGYLVHNHELMLKALGIARELGLRVSLDLASFNVVEANLEFLKDIVDHYVDILFANEEEAKAFTGRNPEEALDELAGHAGIAVVKVGKEGSLVRRGKEKHTIAPIRAVSLDTTGAGDLYASGFLFGLINDLPLENCGAIGSLLAGKVIEVMGAKLTADDWDHVHAIMKNDR